MCRARNLIGKGSITRPGKVEQANARNVTVTPVGMNRAALYTGIIPWSGRDFGTVLFDMHPGAWMLSPQ
jgi:hypothetical protein